MDYKCNNYKPNKEYKRKVNFSKNVRCNKCKYYRPSIAFKDTNYCIARETI